MHVFFFKQKTAYEMRISDWSSDVCSSELFWFKPKSSVPDNGLLRRAVLAYVSDMMLLSTALLPHGTHWSTTRIQNASLNHSLWLHAQPDFSDWMLYSLDSPWAGGGRALCRGSIFDRSGQLDRKSVGEGMNVSVSVDLGVRGYH